MAIDFKMTVDGELMIGPDGDIALVWGDEQIIQEVIFRLKTTKGDWMLSPGVGCSLEEFIGQPNTVYTHTLIEERIRTALTNDGLLGMPEIYVVDMPDTDGNHNEVFILIEFSSLEKDYRQIQVTAGLDLRKGLVYSRSNIRDVS